MNKYIFILFVLLIGCSRKKTELPEGLLSKSEMVNILIDVHLLEAKVQKLYLTKDSAEQVYNYFEKKIFEMRGVNDSLYNASLVFYMTELTEFKKVYDQVVDSLMERQVSMDMKMSVDSTRGLKIVKDSTSEQSDSILVEDDTIEVFELGIAEQENDSISEGDRR